MHYKSHQSAIEINNSFSVKVEDLIREIVIQNDIPYYRIESAVEHNTEDGADSPYMPVIRIITYFEDTVNKISHILHDEFDVDIEKSVNKKKIRIETFAYKNINYTAKLKADRQKQTEYRRSGGKKFEIQICSMLQDAWSGIEKELGYDTTAVPDEAKRDFYRVGALLEMADIEFLKIRTELAAKKFNKQEMPAPQPEPARAEQPVAAAQPVIKEQPVVAAAPVIAEPVARVAEPVIAEQPRVVEQPVVAAPPRVEEPVRVQEPVAAVPEKNPNTFVEHLQAVAKEVQREAAIPQPEPVVAFTPPAAEPARIVSIPVAPQPEPRVEVAPPPPVVQQPVYQAPEPVIPAVAAQAPVQQTPASAPAAQPIAPQRPAPQAAPMGIAPKATVIPAEQPVISGIAASPNINIDSLKELAQSINHIEPKSVAPVVPPVKKEVFTPIPEEPKPVAFTPPQPKVEEPKPAPVVEVIPPVVERIVNVPPPVAAVPPAPVAPPAPVSNMNINGSGIIENTFEAARESVEERSIPLYNEQMKPAKSVVPVDENAQMTDITLREYVMNSKLLKEVDQQIAERAGAKINSDIDIEGDVERLRFLKVYSLKQLHDRITDNKDDIVAFAEKWIGKDNGGSFDSGISLFYLEYLLVGKKNDPAFAVEYVVKFISDNDYSARYIIPTYNSIHNTEAPNFSHLTLKA